MLRPGGGHRDHDPLRVVIAGGGVAALEALVALRSLANGRVDVVVVCDRDTYVERPLGVGEPFARGAARRYGLRRLCDDLGAELVHDTVAEVRPERRQVACAGGLLLSYDMLLVATGARPTPAPEGVVTFDRELCPEAFEHLLDVAAAEEAPAIAITVPARHAWTLPAYELALLTRAWGREQRPGGVRVVVVTPEPTPLAIFGPRASAEVAALLEEAGVEVRCGVTAEPAGPGLVRAGGELLAADHVVSLPVLRGPALPGLPCDDDGFVLVDGCGRVPGAPDVLAAGDGTSSPVKQGGLAAQQAEVAAILIARRAGATTARELPRPVLRGMLPTDRGPRFLRVELERPEETSVAADEPLWWPPAKIASRWLAPHLRRLDEEDDGALAGFPRRGLRPAAA